MISQVEKMMKWGAAAIAAAAALALTGCGMGANTANTTTATALGTISGSVHGGQQPVSGARVYLLSVGQSGYGTGNNANPLLTNSTGYVLTDSGGNFSISGLYSCPSNSQVYLLALGGNPGLAAGTNNNRLVLVAGLGSCSSLTSATRVNINEVSTAAFAYALSGFASNYVQISSSQANIPGMARAFANIPNIINVAGGAPLATTPAGNGVVPVAMINTLADIIAPCVNSTGGDNNCLNLLSAATVPGQAAPTDTFAAMLSIAQNPANNVSQLYNLVSATSPFQPTLTAAPTDFTLGVSYTGGGISQPYGLAVDGSGSVWVSNQGNNSISELNYLGAPQPAITGNNISMPTGVAVDTNGIVYVASQGSNSVIRVGTAGIVSSLTNGGLNAPSYIGIDGNNSIYVTNSGTNTLSVFTPNGTNTGNAIGGGNILNPSGIAVDGSGQVFIASAGNSTIAKYNPATYAFYSTSGVTGGGLSAPSGIAVTNSNVLFLPNSNGTVSEFSNTPSALSGSPYTAGAATAQGGVAIDGLGKIYTSYSSGGIKVLSASGTLLSPASGYSAGGTLSSPTKLGFDISGNLWVANNSSSANSVTEIIGLGAPTVTPLAQGVATGTLATRP